MNVLSTDVPAGIAGHPAHYPNQKLKLVVATGADAKFRCNACMEVSAGYRYSCEYCDFNLHKDCALPEDTLVPPIFNNNKYKFELRREPPGPGKNERRLCDACGTRVHGWYYHCDREGLDLHPCCAKLPMQFKRGEELTFELRKEAKHRCNSCGGSGGYETFWYYRSTCRQTVYLHVRCVKEKLVTCSSEPAGGGVGGGSTSTNPAAPTTTMTSLVQAALEGYSGNKEIVKEVIHAICAAIRGDPTEIITTAAAGFISIYTGR